MIKHTRVPVPTKPVASIPVVGSLCLKIHTHVGDKEGTRCKEQSKAAKGRAEKSARQMERQYMMEKERAATDKRQSSEAGQYQSMRYPEVMEAAKQKGNTQRGRRRENQQGEQRVEDVD